MKYLLLLIPIFIFTSCKKDSPYFPEGFGPDQPNALNYQPMFKNANWVYVTTNGSTYTQNIPGNTVNYGGKKFYEALSKTIGEDSDIKKSYFSVKNHIYTLRSESLEYQMGLELEYLNDTAKVNYTWTRDISDYTNADDEEFELKRINGVIKEKGITLTINGKTYKDVIHTQLTVQVSETDDFEDVATYDFYVAKGIGIIQTIIKSDFYGNTSTQLTSYSVQ